MVKEGLGTSPKSSGGYEADMDIGGLADRLNKDRPNAQEETVEGEIVDEDLGSEHEERAFPKFTEKKIRNMLKAPFALAYVFTGCKDVQLTEQEVDLMLEDAVDVFNELVKINPIWLAVIGLMVNGGAITYHKFELVKAFKAAQAAAKREKEQSQGSSPNSGN